MDQSGCVLHTTAKKSAVSDFFISPVHTWDVYHKGHDTLEGSTSFSVWWQFTSLNNLSLSQ